MIKNAWKFYFNYYKGNRKRLFASVVLSIIQSLFVLPIVLLIKRIVDNILPAGEIQNLFYIGSILMILVILNGGISLWNTKISLNLIKIVVQRLRIDLLMKVYSLSRSFYNEADRNKLHTIIIQDTSRLEEMSTAIVNQLLPSLVISIALSVILIHVNWFLYLIMLTIAPLLFLASKIMGRKIRDAVNAFRKSLETLSKDVWFALWMADLTILQTAEKHEITRQSKNFDDYRLVSSSMAYLRTLFNVVQNSIVGISSIIILIIGGITVLNKAMTLGELLSFYVAAGLLRRHFNPVLSAIPSILAGGESLKELYHFISNKDVNPYTGTQRIILNGNVSLKSVSFRYNEKPIISDVNIELKANNIVAIVGPNGSGKSTILNLILGFYKPQSGTVFAENVPYEKLDMVNLRKQMGVVPQSPMIFPDTIWKNITYGSDKITNDEVYKASEIATAHDFIRCLPDGYESFVGDSGVKLSGGERQKIAIARALLRKPKFLIFDEPTNHLDLITTKKLIDNLKNSPDLPTTLIISHKTQVIKEAEQVFSLERGKLTSGFSKF
jgi:ABC-type multidrug transport system fused ATPase/permease subunit